MTIEDLEARLKKLELRNEELQQQVRTLADIEEIKKLQRAYAYYLEHGMHQEVIDCFADDPNVAFHLVGMSSHTGPDGLRKLLSPHPGKAEPPSAEYLHVTMPLCPIITIHADGESAMGRWYTLGEMSLPMGKGLFYQHMLGIYENEYIRQDGKWKLKVVKSYTVYAYKPEQGFVKKERLLTGADFGSMPEPVSTAIPEFDFNPGYPSGYIVPLHFDHPVTGAPTNEKARNAALKPLERPAHKP